MMPHLERNNGVQMCTFCHIHTHIHRHAHADTHISLDGLVEKRRKNILKRGRG